ncbi:hypothetical protein Scep_008742 [Stephania cephalantha]|uniref:Protein TRIGALACTOSYLDIACYLGLYCEROL 4, chloroplastic n=1 Tax=Stephania cephalantha TaxID=152367 RepID=A0AAP0PFM7_9MAGN
MKKLRWAMDGAFWDLDMSTPVTLDGVARPVPGDPLPLGLSRGIKLTRPKQVDFMHRFMFMPLVPSYSADGGFALQRVLTVPFGDNWFASVLGQFNLQKLVTSVREGGVTKRSPGSSWFKNARKYLCDKSLYALGFCTEYLITQDDVLLVSSEVYGDNKATRNKAVFLHKFPRHDLTVEAILPGLFVEKSGEYWDVPFFIGMDLASIGSNSGSSYHLCIQHSNGAAKQFVGHQNLETPQTLVPGLCVKAGYAIKKSVDIWRSKEGKLKMVQPFDIFLSDPHISMSGILGTVVSGSLEDNSARSQRENEPQTSGGFGLHLPGNKFKLAGDLFASLSCTAQHGHFQRLFSDLTLVRARLDFSSGSKFISGAARLAQHHYNSKPLDLAMLEPICPDVTLSLQQQIVGEFIFRVDSKLGFNFKGGELQPRVQETIYAVEYALKVLGSAKAVAWYSPKHKEAMVELCFFET